MSLVFLRFISRIEGSYCMCDIAHPTTLNVALIALTTSLLMWSVAFLDIGGE